MILSEFKAWFEGFSENIDKEPNKAQWKRIKARVKDIDGTPVTPIVIREYVDRYIPHWHIPYYHHYTHTPATTWSNIGTATLGAGGGHGFYTSSGSNANYVSAKEDGDYTLFAMGSEESSSLS